MATMEDEVEKKQASLPTSSLSLPPAKKTVLTFLGFSGAGYQKPDAILKSAADTLHRFDPKTTTVNIGATMDGIDAIYEIAKDRGFVTTGIASTEALKHDVAISPFVDHVVFVQDKIWGGFLHGKAQLSPTSEAMIAASDFLVAIGGGQVARDELSGARHREQGGNFYIRRYAPRISQGKGPKTGATPNQRIFKGRQQPCSSCPTELIRCTGTSTLSQPTTRSHHFEWLAFNSISPGQKLPSCQASIWSGGQ